MHNAPNWSGTFKSLQSLLQDFESACDQFGEMCIKGLSLSHLVDKNISNIKIMTATSILYHLYMNIS